MATNKSHNFVSYEAAAFKILTVRIGKLESKGLIAKEWNDLRNSYFIWRTAFHKS